MGYLETLERQDFPALFFCISTISTITAHGGWANAATVLKNNRRMKRPKPAPISFTGTKQGEERTRTHGHQRTAKPHQR